MSPKWTQPRPPPSVDGTQFDIRADWNTNQLVVEHMCGATIRLGADRLNVGELAATMAGHCALGCRGVPQ